MERVRVDTQAKRQASIFWLASDRGSSPDRFNSLIFERSCDSLAPSTQHLMPGVFLLVSFNTDDKGSKKQGAPQWTEFLSCPVCCNEFDATLRSPISLGCGHTVCRTCLSNLHRKQCPFDQTTINTEIENLPVNYALLQLVGVIVPEIECNGNIKHLSTDELSSYLQAKKCIEELALYLKPFSSVNLSIGGSGPT
uniref:RING-type domain-containing protein n=1 Tax=Timema cristinae TaxID=61476 RepID=A0A7R9CTC9_TIMCR|nr:unnamed protein product [Timema cristinae]